MPRFFSVAIATGSLFSLLILSVPVAPAEAAACSCYCASKDGAIQPKGAETVPFASCEKACDDLKQKVVACAETADALPVSNPRCFTLADCNRQDGDWDKAYQPPQCIGGAHYCYPKTKPYTLAYTINGKNQVLNIGDFINTFYQYLLIAAFVIATIAIIVGGFQYVLSAGGFGDTKKAKERIRSAVIGFVLLLLIGLILQTVNPQLVKLSPLSLPMLKQSTYDFGLPADTPGVGQGCNADNDCKAPYKCLGAKVTELQGALEKAALAATSVVVVSLVGVGGIVTGIKAVLRFAGKHYYISGAAGAAAALATWSYKGICGKEADRNVPNGGFCEEDKHCVSNKCVLFDGIAGFTFGKTGVCSSGGKGASCSCDWNWEKDFPACSSDACGNDTDGNSMECLETGLGSRQCGSTTGAAGWGNPCNESIRCGGAIACRLDVGRCLKEEQPPGATCKSGVECERSAPGEQDNQCIGPSGIQCDQVDFCVCRNTMNRTGSPCFDSGQCAGGCDGADLTKHIPGKCS